MSTQYHYQLKKENCRKLFKRLPPNENLLEYIHLENHNNLESITLEDYQGGNRGIKIVVDREMTEEIKRDVKSGFSEYSDLKNIDLSEAIIKSPASPENF